MYLSLKKSSNIKRAEYYGGSKILVVTFASGACYEYFQVPQSEILQWLIAESTGKHFCKAIRNKYTYSKI